MVAFDDLDIAAAAHPLEQVARAADQVHRDVHGEAHARRLEHRDRSRGILDRPPIGGLEPRRGHDQRHACPHAGTRDASHGAREREVDRHVGRAGPGFADGHARGRNAGNRPGVVTQPRVPCPLHSGDELPGRRRRAGRCSCGTGDDPLPHAAGGTMNDETTRGGCRHEKHSMFEAGREEPSYTRRPHDTEAAAACSSGCRCGGHLPWFAVCYSALAGRKANGSTGANCLAALPL